MTQIRLDKVILASFIDTFLNYKTSPSSITISGSVLNLTSTDFTTTMTVDRVNTLAEVYAKNRNTGKKMSLLAGSNHNPYQFVSSESISHSVTLSGNILTVKFTVVNATGGTIALTDQIIDITAVMQQVPY